MARWAVTKLIDATDDLKRTAREEVISVHNMQDNHEPEVDGLWSSDHKDKYKVFKCHDRIEVGMVRGGEYGAIDDFGWATPEDNPRPLGDEKTREALLRRQNHSSPERIAARKPEMQR